MSTNSPTALTFRLPMMLSVAKTVVCSLSSHHFVFAFFFNIRNSDVCCKAVLLCTSQDHENYVSCKMAIVLIWAGQLNTADSWSSVVQCIHVYYEAGFFFFLKRRLLKNTGRVKCKQIVYFDSVVLNFPFTSYCVKSISVFSTYPLSINAS